ncbi:MAG: hypothetical protein SFX18_01055 [Pirellulales bacterium]|nr:hypothetical protein [Pirellulales bacterium]
MPPEPFTQPGWLLPHTVLVAEERAARPQALLSGIPGNAFENPIEPPCPFCPGNESATPPEVWADRPAGSAVDMPGWLTRLIPNRYPAARGDTGQHEVLVCCPEHVTTATGLSLLQWELTLTALWRRYGELRKGAANGTAPWKWLAAFQNCGAAAGASIAHLHCQLLALPAVPLIPRQELFAAAERHALTGQCPFCELLASGEAAGDRWVSESANFVALCPAAGRVPYEIWILPKRHNSHFEFAAHGDLADLANLIGQILVAYERIFGQAAWNWWIHSGPFDSLPLAHYHWHIEVIPRTTIQAGFEWSSGYYINTVGAESAAAELRRMFTAFPVHFNS